MKYLLLVTLATLSFTCFAQRAMVKLKTGDIKDIQIKATSADALYIDGGSIRNIDIDTIYFRSTQDPKYEALYTRLRKNSVVLFAGQDSDEPPIKDDRVLLDYNEGHAQFQKVIEVPGKSADLYTMVKRWVATTYNNPNKVTQSTVENEMIRGFGIGAMQLSEIPPSYCELWYIFKIDVKDGKVRFTMYDMHALTSAAGKMSVESYIYKKDGTVRATGQARAVSRSITIEASNLIINLQNALTEIEKKDDDW